MSIQIHLDTTSNSSVVGFCLVKKQILPLSLNQQARQRGKNSHVAIGQRRPKIGLYRYIFNLDRRKTAVCKQFAMRFQDMICQENVEYGQTGFKRQRSNANILIHVTYPENRERRWSLKSSHRTKTIRWCVVICRIVALSPCNSSRSRLQNISEHPEIQSSLNHVLFQSFRSSSQDA